MKKVKILTITLVSVLIALVAIFGIYMPIQNRMENKVKEYSYSMDLKGAREVILNVAEESEETENEEAESDEKTENEETVNDEETENENEETEQVDEETENDEEINNEENYKKSKKIIENRLKKLNVDNYTIKLDEQTGKIVIEIPENDNTDNIISNIVTIGKFEIIDTDTEEVLMDNDDIKLVNVMYGSNSSGTTSSGTTVYLNIEFTKDGANKLEDISNTYLKADEEAENTEETDQTDEEQTENTEETEQADEETDETKEKTITMKIDDETIMSTSFDEPITTGKLQLSVGNSSTDKKTLNSYIEQASNMATILNTGSIPVKYEVEGNQYILSDITKDNLKIVKWIIAGVAVIALIILVLRFKFNGALSAISYIGLISLFLILIRYANVVLSLEGIVGIILIMILNYIFTNILLSKLNNKTEKETVNNIIKETYKEFAIKIVPILIAVITFCFIKWAPISSFGMVAFWGIVVIAIYNLVITNNLLKINASK